jgi:nicotinamidase/pyrazinamidase
MEPSTLPTPRHRALVVVDVQRDFCPGGALAAPHGDRILPALNRHVALAHAQGWTIYATRDWHPAVTTHFRAYGGEWPPHCVQGTPGAAFEPRLSLPPDTIVVSKGEDAARPGYSGFDGRTPDGVPLGDDLQRRGIDSLAVAGIATEYCVKETVLDARRRGLHVVVLTDAIAPIEAHRGDADRALEAMTRAGATLATSL